MACSHKHSCALFPVISLSSALKIWQTFYCEGKHETCERYKLSLAGKPVPASLLPNGKLLDVGTTARPAGAEHRPPEKREARPGPSSATPAPSSAKAPTSPATSAPAPATIVSSYYVRIRVKGTANTRETILPMFDELGVRVDVAFEKPAVEGHDTRCLIFITDHAEEMSVYRAIVRIEALDEVVAVKSIPLERPEQRAAA